jgi:plastocyanin
MRSAALSICLVLGLSRAALGGELVVELRNQLGNTLENAVVYVEPMSGKAPVPAATPRVSIDQMSKQFVPRVSVMQAGAAVSFPNSDNIRHSVYSFSSAKVFTTKLYAGKHTDPVLFDTAGVIVLGCNIHDNMLAWAVVVDTPWFAKSGVDGLATIKNLPAGDYRLSTWYPGFAVPRVERIEIEAQGVTRLVERIDPSNSPLKPGPP